VKKLLKETPSVQNVVCNSAIEAHRMVIKDLIGYSSHGVKSGFKTTFVLRFQLPSLCLTHKRLLKILEDRKHNKRPSQRRMTTIQETDLMT
jgi:hypothetical protein